MPRRVRQTVTAYRSAPPPRVQPPTAKPRARAKLFPNGRSQAVRLPKQFRMPGNEVFIRRDGDRLILEPIGEGPLDANGWPIGLWDEIDHLAAGITVPDIEPLGGRLLKPEEIDRSVKWRK